MGTLINDEKENIRATFKASLESIFNEKLEKDKWKEKIQDLTFSVNIIVQAGDGSLEDEVYLHIDINKGEIEVHDGKVEDAIFSLKAPFEVLFSIATGELKATKALLKRKLKVTRLLRNLRKVLLLQKLMVLE